MTQPDAEVCWRRIGVRGDRSCPELERYIHCMNCPVTARAADELLDRPAMPAEEPAALPGETGHGLANEFGLSLVVFRLGTERFGIECRDAVSVERPRRVQRVPHRRGRGFRGLCNVQGQLRPCASLHLLLGLESPAPEATTTCRLVVVDCDKKCW